MLKNDIQIRFSDIDSFGHVNNIQIQHYYDYGKMVYYSDVLNITVMNTNPSAVLVNVTSNYFSAILITDSIEVETSVVEMSEKTIKFSQRIIDKNTLEVKSDSVSIMVVVDTQKMTSVILPEKWINSICEQENKSKAELVKTKMISEK